MKKSKRKKFLSIIFVPDQDRDPISISLSYAKGLIILIFISLIVLNSILGLVGYYRIFYLEKVNRKLNSENEEIKIKNKKIEQIAMEYQKNKAYIEQILKLSTASPGMASNVKESIKNVRTVPAEGGPKITPFTSSRSDIGIDRIHYNIRFLTEGKEGYFKPQNLPTYLPVAGGHLTNRFQRGGWYTGRSHLGIDIAAKKGTPIRAAGDGVVLLADWTPDFGNVVIISHGGAIFSYYAHAMRILIQRGQRVKRGDTIAFLGSSGFSSAPHLHFEIWKDGRPLDPEKYLYALQESRR